MISKFEVNHNPSQISISSSQSEKSNPDWINKISSRHIGFLANNLKNINYVTYDQKATLNNILDKRDSKVIIDFFKYNVDIATHVKVYMKTCITNKSKLNSNILDIYSFEEIKKSIEKMPDSQLDRLLREYKEKHITQIENERKLDRRNKSDLLFNLYCDESIRQPFAVAEALFNSIIGGVGKFPFRLSDCVERCQFSDKYMFKYNVLMSMLFNLNSGTGQLKLFNFIAANSETIKNFLFADELLNKPLEDIQHDSMGEDEKYNDPDTVKGLSDNKAPWHILNDPLEEDEKFSLGSIVRGVAENDNCYIGHEAVFVDDKHIRHLPITKYSELNSIDHLSTLTKHDKPLNDTVGRLRQILQMQSTPTDKYIECYFNNYRDLPLYQALKNREIAPQEYQYLVIIILTRAYMKEFSASAFVKKGGGSFIFDVVGFSNYLRTKKITNLVPYIIQTIQKTEGQKQGWSISKKQPLFEAFSIKIKIHEDIFNKPISPLAFDLDHLILSKIGVHSNVFLESQSFNYSSQLAKKSPVNHILMRGLCIEFAIMALKLQPNFDSCQCEKLANNIFAKLAKKYPLPKVNISGMMHGILKFVHAHHTSVVDTISLLEKMQSSTVGKIKLFDGGMSCYVANAFNFVLHAFSDNYTPYNRADFALQQKVSTTKAFINFIYNLASTNIIVMQYVELLQTELNVSRIDYNHIASNPKPYRVASVSIQDEINSGRFNKDSKKKQVAPNVGLVKVNPKQIKQEFEPEDLVYRFLNEKIALQHPEIADQLRNKLSFQLKLDDSYKIPKPETREAYRTYSIYKLDSSQKRADPLLIKLITGEFRDKTLTIKQTKQIICQLVDIIKLMYIGRVSHRDLHAGNIKVIFDESDEPLVKVFDFGKAKINVLDTIEDDIRYLFLRKGVTQDDPMSNFVEGNARKLIDEPKHYPLHRLLIELGFSKEEAIKFLEAVGNQLLKELPDIKDKDMEPYNGRIEQAFNNCKQKLLNRCAIYTNSILSDIDITKTKSSKLQQNIDSLNNYLDKITQNQPEQRVLVIELLCILKNCANNNINLSPVDLLANFKSMPNSHECLAVINNLKHEIETADGADHFMQLVDNFSVLELRQSLVENNIATPGRKLLERILTKDIIELTIEDPGISTMGYMDSEDLVLTMIMANGVYEKLSKMHSYEPPIWLVNYISKKYRPYVDADKVTVIKHEQEQAIIEEISKADRQLIADVLNGGTFDLGTMFSRIGWETVLGNPNKLNYKMIPPLLLGLTDPLAKNLLMIKRCEIEQVPIPFEEFYQGSIRSFKKLEEEYLKYSENKEQIDNILESIRLVAQLDNFAIETPSIKRNKVAISSVRI